jgi:hypothetical protein
MGNVMAASQAPSDLSPPASMPPPPPPTFGFPPNFVKVEGSGSKTSPSSSTSEEHQYQKNGLENPGSMEELHKMCKGKHWSRFEFRYDCVNLLVRDFIPRLLCQLF